LKQRTQFLDDLKSRFEAEIDEKV